MSPTKPSGGAIADRLGLAALDRLDAHAMLSRDSDRGPRRGADRRALEQSCVVTGEPVAAHVDEPFALLFVPEPEAAAPDEEIELGDGIATSSSTTAGIDLGGAIADTLALSLDPYPRSAGAEAALKEAGVLTEEQASPFAALAELKKVRRLGRHASELASSL